MNSKRLLLWALVLTLICCSGTVFAANTVVIPSQSVAKGATGVVIPVMLTNDVDLISVVVPLAIREQTPGAFITSMSMGFGDRLPAGGPLSEISFRNQYADEDGNCKDNNPGGFGTITFNDGAAHPVAAAPEGALFVRQKLFTPNLTPGADVTGSYFLTVDVTSVDGTFEIDTTCANPANHLLFAKVGNLPEIPAFTKGIITIGTVNPNTDPEALCQDVTVDADANCQADASIDNGSFDSDGDPITLTQDPAGPYPLGTTLVTLTVEDDQGGSATCQANVTVVDNTAPEITACPADVLVQCSADVPPADIAAVTATDNCGAVTITHQGDVSDNNSCPETITRTYRATDDAGNFVECTQTITVQDTEQPALAGCPANITVACLADVPLPAEVTATDNCDGALTPDFQEIDNATSNPCGGTITRTWTATDACGNTNSCNQVITVNDTEAPVITACATDISVQCEADVPAADIGLITATDNCGSVTVTFEGDGPLTGGACGGTITRTYAATDDCGNSVTCTQTITVNDTENPTLVSSVSNLNLVCPSEVPPILETDVTFTDNCGTPTVSTSRVDNGGAGSAGDPLIITDTYVATDGCGNTAQVGRIITVVDDTPPSLTCPGDITVQEDSPGAGAVVNYADPTYSDNCAGGGFTQIAGSASGATFPLGTTTNTFEATDAAGNTSQCSFDVTVTEGAPALTAVCQDVTVDADANCEAAVTPAQVDNGSTGSNITLSLDPPGPYALGANNVELVVNDDLGGEERCSAVITVVDNTNPVIACSGDWVSGNDAGQCGANVDFEGANWATATDNCGAPVITYAPASGFFPVGTTSVTATAMDGAGNTSTCFFDVTINDTEAPVALCSGDVVVDNDAGDCGAVVSWTSDFTDNCEGGSIACEPVSGSFFDVGATTVTCTATDAAGNTATCSFTVTVNDTEPPTITCPANITVQEDSPGAGAVVNFSDPTYGDNCPGATLAQTGGLPSGSTFPVGTTTNTFEVTDAAGNTASCSFDVTVTEGQVENQPPVAMCTDVTVDADANCEADASIDNGSFDPDGDPITLSQDPPGPYPLGATVVTLTVTDDKGASSTCTGTVTVQDVTPPTMTCPTVLSFVNDPGECGKVVTYNLAADDNCGNVTVSYNPPSNSFFEVGTTTVDATATDDAGNTFSCSFDVVIFDSEDPTIACPGNILVNEEGPGAGAVVTYDDPTFGDNCPGATLAQTGGLPSGSTFPVGTTTNSFEVTDGAGNTASCSFDVTVEEVIVANEPPVAMCTDVTVDADANCEGDASIDNGSYDPDGDPITLSQDPAGPYPLGSTVVTLTVTDDKGASSTCTGTVNVIDVTPPVATCSDDITVTAPFGSGGMVVEYTSLVEDNCSGATIECSPASGSFFPTGTTTVTCTATDGAGNTATCEFVVTVDEEIQPPSMTVNFAVTPGNSPAPFNVNDNFKGDKGVLPVVIFGGPDFDVYDIDWSTVELEGVAPERWNFGDFGGPLPDGFSDCPPSSDYADGYDDAKAKFSRADLIAAIAGLGFSGDIIQVELTGNLTDGTAFSGMDCIRLVGGGSSGSSSLRSSNRPNPFNAGTTISFQLDAPAQVNVSIYNILGQTVITLADGYEEAGAHEIEWDGRNSNGQSLSSGMYFYRIVAGTQSETRKMLLIK